MERDQGLKFLQTIVHQSRAEQFFGNMRLPPGVESFVQKQAGVWMGRVISGRNSFVMLTPNLEARVPGDPSDNGGQFLPSLGIDNRLPVMSDEPVGENVVPPGEKELRRLEVKIKPGTFHSGTRSLPEIDSQVRLVWRLVGAEAGVPVQAENGFVDFGGGHDVRRNLLQAGAHGCGERLGA